MRVLYLMLLPNIIGVLVVLGESPQDNFAIDMEPTLTVAESRILQQIERLSRTLKEEIKKVNDRIDRFKPDTNMTCSDPEEVPNNMFNTTQWLLRNVSEQLQSVSISTERRLIELEHRLDQLPANSGIYFMKPDPTKNTSFEVLRDWTNNHGFGDNWIVFQHRFNGSVDFYRNWTEYKQGFGDLRGEHWLGLDKLHAIVSTRQHELLIVMEDFDGVIAYAHYEDFKIGDEGEKYAIKSVGRYTGTAGDSFSFHKDERFSTYDQDNDKHSANCAQWAKGAWWFYKCHHSHLNGEYLKGKIDRQAGIMWYLFRGSFYSLKSTKMMIRPVA